MTSSACYSVWLLCSLLYAVAFELVPLRCLLLEAHHLYVRVLCTVAALINIYRVRRRFSMVVSRLNTRTDARLMTSYRCSTTPGHWTLRRRCFRLVSLSCVSSIMHTHVQLDCGESHMTTCAIFTCSAATAWRCCPMTPSTPTSSSRRRSVSTSPTTSRSPPEAAS